VWPTLSDPGTHLLLWHEINAIETPQGTMAYMVMAEQRDGTTLYLDTLALMSAMTSHYGAAAKGGRRWAAVHESGKGVHFFYSDQPDRWRRRYIAGDPFGNVGLTVAPLLDSTAIVVGGNSVGQLEWGLLVGSLWEGRGAVLPNELFSNRPQFRRRPSGGLRMAWGSGYYEVRGDHLPMLTFRQGEWTEPESLRCNYAPAGGYFSDSPDLSSDGGEYPAVAWGVRPSTGGQTSICVCVPTDSGFTVADQLPGSLGGIIPRVARDRNGDAWVAWWRFYDGMFWVHSYTTATSATPIVEPTGPHRTVRWTQSEPAPETWWAVLRAGGTGEFAPVARVRAGPGLDMSWTDRFPTASSLLYRIRRESVDRRYEWTSAATRWPPVERVPILLWVASGADTRKARIEFSGAAAGPATLALYDLQGRRVLERGFTASGAERDSFELDLGVATPRLAAGIYFAHLRDAAGATSPAAKLVVFP
jgi:hypothetical protein